MIVRASSSVLALTLLLLAGATRAQMPAASAQYTVRFDAVWSAGTHPTDFPSAAHFSGLIGGTHDDSISFWAPGALASPGMESMAETGSKSPLDAEVSAAISAGQAGQLISGPGIFPSPGTASDSFTASQDHPLATVVTMIAPSPDWFVGVHGVPLFENGSWVTCKVVPLLAYDAGTDSGASFLAANSNTAPPEPIALITGFPFAGGVPLGTFTFTRTDAPGPWTDLGGGTSGVNGVPSLAGSGPLTAGSTITLDLQDGPASEIVLLWLSLSSAPIDIFGGTIHAFPFDEQVLLATDGSGAFSGGTLFPPGVPECTNLWFQFLLADASTVFGITLSNAVRGTTP